MKVFFILMTFCTIQCVAQDSTVLKVHFLYGSKPIKKYKPTEEKWFGGILGGHVGIESSDDSVLNFLPKGKFHLFEKSGEKHSTYAIHSNEQFYSILSGKADSVKKAIVYIPVSIDQKREFDSLSLAYLTSTPYDYALFGMRCAAAAYDILQQLDIVPDYPSDQLIFKIFYPRKLRKQLFKKARQNHWTIVKQAGSARRKWEKL